MIMDTTNNNQNLTNNDMANNFVIFATSITEPMKAGFNAPMNTESDSYFEEKENKPIKWNVNPANKIPDDGSKSKEPNTSPFKRTNSNKSLFCPPQNKCFKTKKNSISLNSLDNIQPIGNLIC